MVRTKHLTPHRVFRAKVPEQRYSNPRRCVRSQSDRLRHTTLHKGCRCGQLRSPAMHGNSIALLDHIEDFYFCRRLYSRPHAIFAACLHHLAGALMSHRQGGLARAAGSPR